MNEYTASNTATIRRYTESFEVKIGNAEVWIEPWIAAALREFFRAEEDERLGRWRDPERPSFAVYPQGEAGIIVLSETTGLSRLFADRADVDAFRQSYLSPSAYAFLNAHPEPKPWRDAIPGDSWVIVYLNEEVPAVASSSESGHIIFTASTNQGGGTEEIRTDSKHITAGRRIWPPEES